MEPAVQALIQEAIDRVATSLALAPPLKTVIQSVSAKQRPRGPPVAAERGAAPPRPNRTRPARRST
jgi:hypothetical protein